MARLTLTLLGGFQARAASRSAVAVPGRKAQALLAYLALPAGQAHPRERLAALLWGESGETQARDSLRQALAALRKALPASRPPCLLVTSDTVALNPAAVEVDVATFERRLAAGTPTALAEAAALYRGDLLEGLHVSAAPFEEWLLSQQTRLRELALQTLSRLLAQQAAAGAPEPAIETAGRLLALDPLQEAAHRALMRLHAGQGRWSAALRQYQICVGVLQRELGVEPEAETKRLYRELLRQRTGPPATGPAASGPAPGPPREAPRLPRRDAPTRGVRLVGRQAERARLTRALDEAGRGRGQVAAVLGEAGIGKTRLLEDLAADAARRGGRVLWGRAYESEQILPFGPWTDALRSGQVAGEAARLEGFGPAWRAELARLLPELGEPAAPLSSASDSVGRLFEAVTRLVGGLAARQPLLLVLEDLHWADEMSLRLLSSLGQRLRAWPGLLVASARQEEVTAVPALRRALRELGREGALVEVTLSPLSRPETLDLVRALARTGSTAATLARLGEKVWAVSEGNPFMVVETMRALREGETPTGSRRLALPQRVREVIAGRLERLSERSRQLVAVAAVIGREFDVALLPRAAGLGARRVAAGVEELVQRRVLHAVGERFDFTHDRIREVAYTQLLPPRRALLHRRVGSALEALGGDTLEPHHAALAAHFREGAVWPKAVRYLTRVAEGAARTYAHAEAMAALQEADRHVERLPAEGRDRIHLDLVLRQCDIFYFLARPADTVEVLLRERACMERLGAPDLAGRYHFQLARAYSLLGDREAAAASAQRAVEATTRSGDDVTRGKAHYVLSREKFWLGEPGQGLDHGLEAARLLEGRGEPYWLAMAYMWTGQSHYLLGDFVAALGAMGRARELAEAIGDSRLQSDFAWRTAQVEATRGEWEAAIALCERALGTPSSHPLNRANAVARLGLAHVEAGDPAAAIPRLEQALEDVAGIAPTGQARGWFLALLGEARFLAGELAGARECVTQALAILEAARYRDGIARARRTLGRIAQAQGAHGEATRLLTQALDLYASESARFEVGRTRLALAELAQAQGDREGAGRHLREAYRLFAALGVQRYIARAEAAARESGLSL